MKANVEYTGDVFNPSTGSYMTVDDSFTVRSNATLELVYTDTDEPFFINITTLTKPTTRFGYTFAGWRYTNSSAGELLSPNTYMTLVDEVNDHFDGYAIDLEGVWEKAVDADANVLYFKTNGTMKKAKNTYVKVNGSYKPALAIFIKKDGIWRTKSPS